MDGTPGRMIDVEHLPLLARGCSVMGAGGGGDPLVGMLMAGEAIRAHGPVPLVDLDDLPADALVMPCGLVGSPTVVIEKLQNGAEGARLVEEVEALCGRPVAALMPFEIGGSNGLIPLTWAARLRLPYVDADGMGRAFPTMPQMTMHLAGVPATPCVLVDERLTTLVIRTEDVGWTERVLRAVAGAFGGAGVAALYLMDVETARRATVRRSVSRALDLGAALDSAIGDPVEALLAQLDATELIRGKVVDVERHTTGRFVEGSAVIHDLRGDGRLIRLEIQNENLVAIEDGQVLASVPDLITVVDSHTGEPIVTERLRYGQPVSVVAFACDPIWRSPAGLRVAGPVAFGYDFDYVPIDAPTVAPKAIGARFERYSLVGGPQSHGDEPPGEEP